MSGSGLAAVHAAAALSSTAAAALLTPSPAVAVAAAPPAAATLAELQAAYPDLCVALRAEGANAERTRISGIEAHALPGHEALIAAMKADGTVSPDVAAGRILAAERAARGTQLQAIKDVETVTGAVAAAPASHVAAAAPGAVEKASTPEGWAAEYAGSAALQGEFANVADYVAIKKAEAGGRVKVLGAARGK